MKSTVEPCNGLLVREGDEGSRVGLRRVGGAVFFFFFRKKKEVSFVFDIDGASLLFFRSETKPLFEALLFISLFVCEDLDRLYALFNKKGPLSQSYLSLARQTRIHWTTPSPPAAAAIFTEARPASMPAGIPRTTTLRRRRVLLGLC